MFHTKAVGAEIWQTREVLSNPKEDQTNGRQKKDLVGGETPNRISTRYRAFSSETGERRLLAVLGLEMGIKAPRVIYSVNGAKGDRLSGRAQLRMGTQGATKHPAPLLLAVELFRVRETEGSHQACGPDEQSALAKGHIL